MKNIIVKKCDGCPLLYYSGSDYICNLDYDVLDDGTVGHEMNYDEIQKVPDWCPIKGSGITINIL